MPTWAVIHLIHVRTPHRHIARLFVEDVPEDVPESDVRAALTRAGRAPAEFNTPWANHYLARLDEAADEVVEAYGSGRTTDGPVPVISWTELADPGERRLTVRIPPELHQRITLAAQRAGRSLNSHVIMLLEREEREAGPGE